MAQAQLGLAERPRQPSGRSGGSTHLGSWESLWCGRGRACLGETSAWYWTDLLLPMFA